MPSSSLPSDERLKRRRKTVLLTLFITPKIIMLVLVVSQFVTFWLQPPSTTSGTASGGPNFHPLPALRHEFTGSWKLSSHQDHAPTEVYRMRNETALHHRQPHPADTPLSPSLQQYRKLYVIADSNNATNHTVAPIRYVCTRLCGGAGDRLHGIVQLFYHGLCLKRPLYVDWRRPFPLSDYLEPNHLSWQVKPRPMDASWQTLSLIDAPQSPQLRVPRQFPAAPVHVRLNQWRGDNATHPLPCLQPFRLSHETPLFRQAFWTLFRWSPGVLQAAERTRQQLGLTPLYVAVHLRTGRANPSYKDYVRSTNNESTWVDYFQCAIKLQRRLQTHCQAKALSPIYLATDTPAAKHQFRLWDPRSVRTAMDSEVFHLDRSSPRLLQNASAAHLQVFVDLLLLSESACLVTSDSKFSSTAQYLQDPPCAVRWDTCDDDATVKQAVARVHC